MGIRLAQSSVWAILRRHGIEPSPRHCGPSWTEFLRSKASSMLACDFFTVDMVLLRRLYILFFIELDSRRVYLTGITKNPVREWIAQQARNLSMVLAEGPRPIPVPYPGSGRQVHGEFRCRLQVGRHSGDPYANPGATCQRLRRARRGQCPPGVPRSAAYLSSASTRRRTP